MATKKKVIQGGLDVQKSDGTSALTVDETSGAATVGPSGSTATHVINGYLNIKTATISLANDATAVFCTGLVPFFHKIRIDAPSNARMGEVVTTGGALTAAVAIPLVGAGTIALSTTANNSATVNVYYSGSGSTYTIQNKTGVAIVVNVYSISAPA